MFFLQNAIALTSPLVFSKAKRVWICPMCAEVTQLQIYATWGNKDIWPLWLSCLVWLRLYASSALPVLVWMCTQGVSLGLPAGSSQNTEACWWGSQLWRGRSDRPALLRGLCSARARGNGRTLSHLISCVITDQLHHPSCVFPAGLAVQQPSHQQSHWALPGNVPNCSLLFSTSPPPKVLTKKRRDGLVSTLLIKDSVMSDFGEVPLHSSGHHIFMCRRVQLQCQEPLWWRFPSDETSENRWDCESNVTKNQETTALNFTLRIIATPPSACRCCVWSHPGETVHTLK